MLVDSLTVYDSSFDLLLIILLFCFAVMLYCIIQLLQLLSVLLSRAEVLLVLASKLFLRQKVAYLHMKSCSSVLPSNADILKRIRLRLSRSERSVQIYRPLCASPSRSTSTVCSQAVSSTMKSTFLGGYILY